MTFLDDVIAVTAGRVAIASWALWSATCVAVAPARPPALVAPAPAAGWFCFEDSAGTLCARTLPACRATELELGFGDGTSCVPVAIAYCVTYVNRDGGDPDQVCLARSDDCASFSAYLRTPDRHGLARVRAGSVTPCVATP